MDMTVIGSDVAIISTTGTYETIKYSSGETFEHFNTLNTFLSEPSPHRVGGAAVIVYNMQGSVVCQEWYQNGARHRIDGPAYVEHNSRGDVIHEEWCQNGGLHRVDGPAVIEYSSGKVRAERWFIEGRPHRIGGPATVEYDTRGSVILEAYYQNGYESRPDESKL